MSKTIGGVGKLRLVRTQATSPKNRSREGSSLSCSWEGRLTPGEVTSNFTKKSDLGGVAKNVAKILPL